MAIELLTRLCPIVSVPIVRIAPSTEMAELVAELVAEPMAELVETRLLPGAWRPFDQTPQTLVRHWLQMRVQGWLQTRV
jgi:hypothetical protein